MERHGSRMKNARIEDVTAYEIIEKREIRDIHSMSYLLRHKKTGARIALLENDDDNKVFCIGFRTPPTDSTGVPHIIEHTVLCGSKEFPVKDPFVELVKGSLNTFLNAMTYSDKTVYPVASCNDKDFQNLCHVYMDAVFYPNIYKEEKIFRQEGWHYEMESPEDELTVNGVVYNEMKGAFSSPDDVHDREVLNSLYPDTAYGVESGGDPKVIPELTYEAFLDFHRRYYHPSNSYIYLYGDMDMAEKLRWMDEEYLSKFDSLQIDSAVQLQKPFAQPVFIQKDYPVMEGESLEDNTYLSYNTVVGTSLDKELYYAMQLIDYALCSSSGAPLKLALIHKNIGTEVYSVYENGVYQPYFSIVAKNANDSQKDEFVQTIEEELARIVKEGLDKKALLAALNYYEFKYREADFGSYPKGLMYGLQMFDSWLYDDKMAFDMIEANDIFKTLREKINTNYYEEMIDKYLLHNQHKSILMVSPKEGLTAANDKALADKLQAYKAALSQEEILKIVEETQALHDYQDAEDSPEALSKIPMLTRADMKKEAEGFVNEERVAGDTKVLFHQLQTNGIGYVKLVFDVSNIPQELFAYMGILKNVLGYVDTQNYSYGELYNEINIHTGGISSTVNTYTNSKKLDEYSLTFEVKTKAMYGELANTFALLQEIMTTSRMDDRDRIYEIIAELKSRMQGSMTASGHSLAAIRALSYFSETAAIMELVSGMPCYRLLEKLEAEYEELMKKIGELKAILADRKLLLGVIKKEILVISEKYGDERRTSIGFDEFDISMEDLIPRENVVITMTKMGYIKRMSMDTFKSQNRGGKGIKGMQILDDDYIKELFITTTHHYIMFFTNTGRVYRLKGYEIPEASRTARGTAIINLLQLMPDEKITAMIPIREYEDGQYLLMATEKGLVKKTPIKDYANVRKTGLAAIVLREDDKLIEVKITDDEQDVILVTKYGMCIRFSEKDVRPTGRVSMGVRGMNLGDHDEVIGMQISDQGKYLLIASEKGMGKLTDMDEFTRQNRGGKGVKCYKITEKTGDVVGMKAVDEDSEIMMINTEGIVIRMKCSDISVYGRITSGVKLINLPENEKVASIAKVRKASAEIDGEEIEISEDEEETDVPIEE